jgi:hypothetical protein
MVTAEVLSNMIESLKFSPFLIESIKSERLECTGSLTFRHL